MDELDEYNHQKVRVEASASVLSYSFSAFSQQGSGISCVHYSSLDTAMKRCCNLDATAVPRDGTSQSQSQLSVHPPLGAGPL